MDLPDIDVVAREVHAAWLESKRARGVSTRQSEDGEELMVPYEVLSETSKELDRATVRAVYAAIRKASAESLDGPPSDPPTASVTAGRARD